MKLYGKTVFTYSVMCSRDVLMFAMMNTETNGIRHYDISMLSGKDSFKKIISSLMCKDVCWCTYNGRYHDETILNYCIINYKTLSQKSNSDIAWLMNNFCGTIHTAPVDEWKVYKHAHKFQSFDLSVLFNNKMGIVDFEQAKMQLRYPDIKPRVIDKTLSTGSRRQAMNEMTTKNVREYARMLDDKMSEVLFRELLWDEYNINAANSNISSIGLKLLDKYYSAESGGPVGAVDNKYNSVSFKELIPEGYAFNTDKYNSYLDEVKKIVITADNSVIDLPLPDYSATLTMGGLKGMSREGVFRKGDKHIYHVDIKSSWPSALVNFKIVPEGLDVESFVYAIKQMVELKETTRHRDCFKRAVNSVIGNFMAEDSPIHDYKAFLKIKLMASLETISLIEALGGIEVLQINNDGIVFMSDTPMVQMRHIVSGWCDEHKLKATFKEYDIFAQHTINDWFAYNGELVKKGLFASGSNKYPPAIVECVIDAIIDNLPLERCMPMDDKTKYVFYERAGTGSELYTRDGDGPYIKTDNIVRYYVAKKGVGLYRKSSGSGAMRLVDNTVAMIDNDRVSDLSMIYYTAVAYALYSQLTIVQQKLF